MFKQIRVAKNRRNHINVPRYYLSPKLGELFKDRRKYKDVFRDPISERRKPNHRKLYYFCPKNRKLMPDRRKTNLNGRPFIFYKFRTMYPDAKERFPELYAYHYTKEEIKHVNFKIKNDPRVPQWAKWLRQSSLDELPNFISVLRGDMSIVGPRPDIPEMMKYYTGAQSMKLNVKPGITGLAQVEGRGHLSFQEGIKYDVEYAKNQSFLLDMKIVIRTIRECFHRNGAF
ncbi:MAG: sugar transferase [Planctomycetota bacterium]|jgi:lipopolysaccharide/colanic/teichoic acid biosynthesis glycosyltransferase